MVGNEKIRGYFLSKKIFVDDKSNNLCVMAECLFKIFAIECFIRWRISRFVNVEIDQVTGAGLNTDRALCRPH